jgi:hypothetical protein
MENEMSAAELKALTDAAAAAGDAVPAFDFNQAATPATLG